MHRKIAVLHIVPDLGIGGLPRVVQTLCSATDRDRFTVSVLCLNALGETARALEGEGIAVHLIPKSGGTPDRRVIQKVTHILRRLGPDVVHTHNTQALLEGVPAARWCGIRAIVHTDHGRQYPDRFAYVFAERVLSRLTSSVVAVSDETAAQLLRHQRIPAALLAVVRNGVLPIPTPTASELAVLRSSLGLNERGPLIGIAARLVPEKGFEYLLRGMRDVASEYPDATLVIVGSGPLEDELRALADALQLGSSVLFLGLRTDVGLLTHLFDLYVLSSVSEGLPLAILEAMAAGKPVVATGVGGIPRAVAQGISGTLVAPADPSALATAICELLADPSKMSRYGREGQRIFRSEFTARTMASRYEDLYLRALGRSAPA